MLSDRLRTRKLTVISQSPRSLFESSIPLCLLFLVRTKLNECLRAVSSPFRSRVTPLGVLRTGTANHRRSQLVRRLVRRDRDLQCFHRQLNSVQQGRSSPRGHHNDGLPPSATERHQNPRVSPATNRPNTLRANLPPGALRMCRSGRSGDSGDLEEPNRNGLQVGGGRVSPKPL